MNSTKGMKFIENEYMMSYSTVNGTKPNTRMIQPPEALPLFAIISPMTIPSAAMNSGSASYKVAARKASKEKLLVTAIVATPTNTSIKAATIPRTVTTLFND